MRYQFVTAHQAEHPITRLFQTLGVSRSGYYAWRRAYPVVAIAWRGCGACTGSKPDVRGGSVW